MITGAHLFVTLYEAPALARTFGEAYEAYRARTDRSIPLTPA